jgi:tetratricopeptide (TPR) repeat protein
MKALRGIEYSLILLLVFSFPAHFVFAGQSRPQDAFQKGLAALQSNRYAEALVEFTAAEREHPEDARNHNFRGIALARLGQNSEATHEYQESIRLDPLMQDAYRNLGFLEWTQHSLDPAQMALERAVQLQPSDSFAHYYLGRVLLDAHRYAPAIRELEMSRTAWPSDLNFSIELATAYVAIERRDDARKSLANLAAQSLDAPQSIQVADLLLEIHEGDSAIQVIQNLTKGPSTAGTSWAKFDLALVHLFAGKDEKALELAHVYDESLSRETSKSVDSAEAWTLIGVAKAHMGQGEPSVEAFHQAAALAPRDEESWLNLTRELMELSRYAEAISATQEGLSANPRSYALRLRLGAAQLAAGHYAEAENAFRELVIAGDPLPTSYLGLAQVLLRTDRAEEAASEMADAQQKLGSNFLISYFRGLALERAGKRPEALAAFQEAVRLDPKNAQARLSVGKTELALGHVPEAIADLQEVLRLDPGNIQAKRLLSHAYRRAGDSKNAAAFADNSADPPVAPESDLLGDFFVPHWRVPSPATK